MKTWKIVLMLMAFAPLALAEGQGSDNRRVIFVGGVDGFASLADPAASQQLRATGRVELYQHTNAIVAAAKAGYLPAIVRSFASTGPGQAELPFITRNPDKWFHSWFKNMFLDRGLHPTSVNVNLADYTELDQPEFLQVWKTYVDAARRMGVGTVAPLFSPNTRFAHIETFDDPLWNGVREAALYGGALGFDSPPHFFFQREQRYRTFVLQEIRWARQHGLRATVIISPNVSRDAFLSDTKRYIEYLQQANAMGTDWVVENYEGKAPPGWPNMIGRETEPNTITAVALWLAQTIP